VVAANDRQSVRGVHLPNLGAEPRSPGLSPEVAGTQEGGSLGRNSARGTSRRQRLFALILMCGWCGLSDTTTDETRGAQRTIEVAGTTAPVRGLDPALRSGWGEVSPLDTRLLMCGTVASSVTAGKTDQSSHLVRARAHLPPATILAPSNDSHSCARSWCPQWWLRADPANYALLGTFSDQQTHTLVETPDFDLPRIPPRPCCSPTIARLSL
jgi:hypothetical protein